jgi:hypothetical protein
MSLLSRQGHFVVIRDSEGKVVSKVMEGKSTKDTFRRVLRKLSNDGLDYAMALDEIARGKPFQVELPDGRVSDPQVAPLGVRADVLKFLWEQMHGKAVDQTKVVEAEVAAEDAERYRSMTEEQLRRLVAEDEEDAQLVAGTHQPTPDDR